MCRVFECSIFSLLSAWVAAQHLGFMIIINSSNFPLLNIGSVISLESSITASTLPRLLFGCWCRKPFEARSAVFAKAFVHPISRENVQGGAIKPFRLTNDTRYSFSYIEDSVVDKLSNELEVSHPQRRVVRVLCKSGALDGGDVYETVGDVRKCKRFPDVVSPRAGEPLISHRTDTRERVYSTWASVARE